VRCTRPRKDGANRPGRWTLFFVALAILNEVIWRTETTDLWVKLKTFGFLPITLLFALAQAPLVMCPRRSP
jgi:intracellular septation protein